MIRFLISSIFVSLYCLHILGASFNEQKTQELKKEIGEFINRKEDIYLTTLVTSLSIKIRELIKDGANPNIEIKNDFNHSIKIVVAFAVDYDPSLIPFLKEHGVNYEHEISHYKTALMRAVICGKTESISSIISCGIDPNKPLLYQNTGHQLPVIFFAIAPSLRALVEGGADINFKNESNNTAWMRKFILPNWGEILLESIFLGADIELKNDMNETVFECAGRLCSDEARKVIEIGQSYFANLRKQPNGLDNEDILEVLIATGKLNLVIKQIGLFSIKGETVIHTLVVLRYNNSLRWLLYENSSREQFRNSINKPNLFNQTPLYIALVIGNIEAAMLLLGCDANPDISPYNCCEYYRRLHPTDDEKSGNLINHNLRESSFRNYFAKRQLLHVLLGTDLSRKIFALSQ
jgi:ankyrin repeat protein